MLEVEGFVRLDIEKTRKRCQRRVKRIIIKLFILLIMNIAVGVTYAMLKVSTNSALNEFTLGKTKVTVNENWDGWDVKEVTLTADKGDDYVPGVVRAMLVPYILDSDGNYIPCDLSALSEPVDNKMVLGDITLEFVEDWSANWFYRDGYFYYRKILYPNDPDPAKGTTTILLKKVSLTYDTEEMREKYADTEIKIEVMAVILQAEGGAPQQEWGVTVTGDTVSP